DGIPLAFCINPGNKNEQQSLIPLEKTLMKKFDMSEFIVCTDAGLSSNTNRIFNNYSKDDGTRDYITTQSVKKLKKLYKEWALSPDGWYLSGEKSSKVYNLNELDEDNDFEKTFYKSRWIKEKVDIKVDGVSKKVELEQQLIVTYSIKYRNYLRNIRKRQIECALKAVDAGSKVVKKKKQMLCMKPLLWFKRLLDNHFEGIIAHATYDISAGKIEGINNKIKTLRRQAYGYRDDEYFFLKLFDISRTTYVRNPLSHKICD
ncbi:MAG: transposase, partial [Lachnospiraceae bacterium]